MRKFKVLSILILLLSFGIHAQDNTSLKSVVNKVPIYPKCKGSQKALKKCFTKNIKTKFAENFNTDLPNQLSLKSGKYRVSFAFTITNTGEVEDVLGTAPHIKLKEEIERVVKLLPKMTPGEQNNKKVAVKFSIPFTLFVD